MKGGVITMSKTNAGKKKVYVHSYKTSDGKIIRVHYRSTPDKKR